MKNVICVALSALLAMLTFSATPFRAAPEERVPDPPDVDELSVW